MKKKINKQVIFYILFTLIVFGFFMEVRFPGKVVGNYILATMAERYPGVSLSLADPSLSFPPGLRIKNVVFRFRENMESNIRLDSLVVRPRLFGYLSGHASFASRAAGYGGTMQGRITFPGFATEKSPTRTDLTFKNIALEKCSYLKERLGRQITGKFGGTLTYNGGTSELDFTVKNGSYPLMENLLGFTKLDFSQAEGQLALKGGTLKINKFQLKGDKISCSLRGDIVLNPDFKNSSVNLSGTMQMAAGPNNRKMSLAITGTVGNAVVKYQ